MIYEHRKPDVAVFIDFENVYVSVRDKLDANPNFETIMDRCNDIGRVVISRAYADWYRYPRITSALYANSIEPIYVPTYYYDRDMGRTGRAIKNSVDMNLCIDAMKALFIHTSLQKFVLVTGDRDFIPLVNSIRQQGKEVTVIGIGGAASTHLAQSADEFIFYEQLISTNKQISSAPVASAPAAPTQNGSNTPAPTPQEESVYDVLVRAVHLVRERGYVSTLGSLKLVMKELMGGDFKENRYRDSNGRPFGKFKDFVLDAERRGKVQIYTSGTVNEVFLPGEDAAKLSQFAVELKEEPHPVAPTTPAQPEAATEQERSEEESTSSRSRRRRRPRSARRAASRRAREEAGALLEGAEDADHTHEQTDEQPAQPDEQPPQAEPLDEQPQQTDEQPASQGAQLDMAAFMAQSYAESDIDRGWFSDSSEPFTNVPEAFALGDQEAQPDEQPAQPDEQPAQPDEQPAQPDEQPAQPDEQPAQPDEQPAQPDEQPAQPDEQPETFTEAEWQSFRQMMAGFDKPTSFQAIFNNLRDLRNQQVFTRTNEQLRSLIKQAILDEVVERTVRGARVYYSLPDPQQTLFSNGSNGHDQDGLPAAHRDQSEHNG